MEPLSNQNNFIFFSLFFFSFHDTVDNRQTSGSLNKSLYVWPLAKHNITERVLVLQNNHNAQTLRILTGPQSGSLAFHKILHQKEMICFIHCLLNIRHAVLVMLMQSASISLVMRGAFGLQALNRIARVSEATGNQKYEPSHLLRAMHCGLTGM